MAAKQQNKRICNVNGWNYWDYGHLKSEEIEQIFLRFSRCTRAGPRRPLTTCLHWITIPELEDILQRSWRVDVD